MDKKNKTLGRGLDEIFGGDVNKIIDNITNSRTLGKPHLIQIEKLVSNPYQPRKQFYASDLEGLSQSIKENGLFTPILVKENEDGNYFIVAGERRVRAAKLAGLNTISAVIATITNDEMQRIALVENIQREDLNPIEVAKSIEDMVKRQKLKQEEIANIIGKSRSYVANLLGILKLDNKILNAVLNDKITFGHAKPLITLNKNEAIIIYKKILSQNLSVRETENYAKVVKVRRLRNEKNFTPSEKRNQELIYAEELVRNKLKTKVEINLREIKIKYKGKDQLSRILERMDVIEK